MTKRPDFLPFAMLPGIVVLVTGILLVGGYIDKHKDAADQTEQVSPVVLPSTSPENETNAEPESKSVSDAPGASSELKIQPGPCEGFPGTVQVIANVCDDGNGSFFVRLNPLDDSSVRISHLMERLRSYRLDFLDRRILSVTPVTDTLCEVCRPVMYGAYGRYERVK